MENPFKALSEEHLNFIVQLFLDNPQLVKCAIIQNFSTKQFCKHVNICDKEVFEENRIPTNQEKGFENFFQSIYHAGTPRQFYTYAKIDKYLLDVSYTMHYLFMVFKKGIYVEIKHGNLRIFLAFSNSNYINDWGQNLKLAKHLEFNPNTKEGYVSVLNLQEKNHKNSKNSNPIYHTMIQRNLNRWYANYCFFRNTVYKNGDLYLKDDEGDKSVANFLELLTEVCYTRVIPDVQFFISPRDYPIIRKDLVHPYDRLYKFSKFGIPKLGDRYPKKHLLPIFSQSITDDYADLMIPNDDDIKLLLCKKKEMEIDFNKVEKMNLGEQGKLRKQGIIIDWENKKLIKPKTYKINRSFLYK